MPVPSTPPKEVLPVMLVANTWPLQIPTELYVITGKCKLITVLYMSCIDPGQETLLTKNNNFTLISTVEMNSTCIPTASGAGAGSI